jgi:periplasmic protein TonB
MASPAKIEQLLPDTLPEDFGDWDNEESASAAPVRSGGVATAPGLGAAAKPPVQPAKPQPPVVRKAVSLIRPGGTTVDGMRNSASLKAAAMRDADEVLLQSIRSNRASVATHTRTNKNWAMVAAVAVCLSVVLLVLIPVLYRGRLPFFRHATETRQVATDVQPDANTSNPPQAMQQTPVQQPAATVTQKATVSQPAADKKSVTPPQVQSKMMNEQLNAPTRIPHDVKSKAAEDAPSSLGMGAANMMGQGNNNAIGNVFNGQAQANVSAAPPKTVSVSAGIAGGLLIQSTSPVYPDIAQRAHITGTVVLRATISKTGMVQNLRVVSGPAMLTQAALDAVRTWRYKPYKLDNEPVEIETTVNVNFTLGG